MKLFMARINKKKVQQNEIDASDEEEEAADISDDKDSIHSNDELSSESSDECLHMDTQEDIRMKI
jgi:hypothetical protein